MGQALRSESFFPIPEEGRACKIKNGKRKAGIARVEQCLLGF